MTARKPFSDMVIVRATLEDAPAIAALNKEQLHQKIPHYPNFKWDTLPWITEQIENDHYYIAKDSNGLAGAICFSMHTPNTGIIEAIAVRPDKAATPGNPGQGIGRKLINKATEVLHSKGAEKLIVLSFSAYDAAGFYAKCGFTQDNFYFEKPLPPRSRIRQSDGSQLNR